MTWVSRRQYQRTSAIDSPLAVLRVARHADVHELSLDTLDVILDTRGVESRDFVFRRGALAHETSVKPSGTPSRLS